jgi:tRNA(Ile)-lysidine synthase
VLDLYNLVDEIVCQNEGKRIWVAFSGGVDSHVLLHLLATANHYELTAIHAIHIDHGLNPDSNYWAQHCAEVAKNLNVVFRCIKVDVLNIETLGMEAAARAARYQALQQGMTQDDVLLTAQHQQDQAETLLLQLLRGAGPKGLSAMAKEFQLGKTSIFRPLLKISQADILAYAEYHKLQWIDDPSNVETRWNRNYIRHNVWPVIEQRWPSASKTLSRSAEHCAEADELLTELAQQDLAQLGVDCKTDSLPISQLLRLSSSRCRNLLRNFIAWKQLPLPSTACLQRVIDEVCLAKSDGMPVVSWHDVEVRRYQDQLYFMPPITKHDDNQVIMCNGVTDVIFDDQLLTWQKVDEGINEQLIKTGLTIRFRQGGERIKPQGQNHHKSLKHLFQQWAIPPWQRDRIPLLFCGDELVAVVGHCISDAAIVSKGQQGYFPTLKNSK